MTNTKPIHSFEEIMELPADVVKSVINSISLEDLAMACMGTSPDNRDYIIGLYEDSELRTAIQAHESVLITKIEDKQREVISKINEILPTTPD